MAGQSEYPVASPPYQYCCGVSASGAPLARPADKIGIGDQWLPETEQIGANFRQRVLGERNRVLIAGDVAAGKAFAQRPRVDRSGVCIS